VVGRHKQNLKVRLNSIQLYTKQYYSRYPLIVTGCDFLSNFSKQLIKLGGNYCNHIILYYHLVAVVVLRQEIVKLILAACGVLPMVVTLKGVLYLHPEWRNTLGILNHIFKPPLNIQYNCII